MEANGKKKAVVLFSGGLDSTTLLAKALAEGYETYGLSFDYGQRHSSELNAALKLSNIMGAADHKVISLDLRAIGGSALTDLGIDVPDYDSHEVEGQPQNIPITYVPARNTVFLSIAMGYAEVLGAHSIFIGVNAVDYSGYPDCRPEFIEAFQRMADLATKEGIEGQSIRIETPLIDLTKGDIINLGLSLGVDYAKTVSCYQANGAGQACGKCDSCGLRAEGFAAAGVPDPTVYI